MVVSLVRFAAISQMTITNIEWPLKTTNGAAAELESTLKYYSNYLCGLSRAFPRFVNSVGSIRAFLWRLLFLVLLQQEFIRVVSLDYGRFADHSFRGMASFGRLVAGIDPAKNIYLRFASLSYRWKTSRTYTKYPIIRFR